MSNPYTIHDSFTDRDLQHDGLSYLERGKSLRAVDAEDRGLMTASKMAKRLGISTSAVKKFCYSSEWHHCSAAANHVNYYDLPSEQTLQLAKEWDEKRKKDIANSTVRTYLLSKVRVPRTKVTWKYGRAKYQSVMETLNAIGITIKPGQVMATITYPDLKIEKVKVTGLRFAAIDRNGNDLFLSPNMLLKSLKTQIV